MTITPATVETMSPAFQALHADFIEARTAYLDSQSAFLEVTKETERLEQAAQALDAQAEEADAAWKEMAKARSVDQRKLNQGVERVVELKMEAEKLRRVAAVRAGLREEMLLRAVAARREANTARSTLQGRFYAERIETLLAALEGAEGLPELLRELRELAGDDFAGMVARIAAQAQAPDLSLLNQTCVPAPIPAEAEIKPKTPVEARLARMNDAATAAAH